MSYEGTSLVVEDVPADICDTCGELYFDEHVTQRLLDLAREGGEPSRELFVALNEESPSCVSRRLLDGHECLF